MSDKRILERKHLIYYLQVVDRDTGELIGRLVDITAEGIMLLSEQPLPTGQVFQLRMLLPKEASEGDHLDFTAKSLWSARESNPDLYDTGFQFVGVTIENAKIIEDLISDYGFPES
jgi:PilZ domain